MPTRHMVVPIKNVEQAPLGWRHGPEVPLRHVARGHTAGGAGVGRGAVKEEHSLVPTGQMDAPVRNSANNKTREQKRRGQCSAQRQHSDSSSWGWGWRGGVGVCGHGYSVEVPPTIANTISGVLARPSCACVARHARLWLGHRQCVLEALHSVRWAAAPGLVGVARAHTRRGPAGSTGARHARGALEGLGSCRALLRASVGAVTHTTWGLAGTGRAHVAALEGGSRWGGAGTGGPTNRPGAVL